MKGWIVKWCRYAELNHEFILTMDVYCHYTIPALIAFLLERYLL